MRLLSYTFLQASMSQPHLLTFQWDLRSRSCVWDCSPLIPQGINSSWGIGCKHNGIRHPARGDCCTVPLGCDIHAYCSWDIYWIKVDDVVLYIFSQLKRQNKKKPCGASWKQKPVSASHKQSSCLSQIITLKKQYICLCLFEVIKIL